MNHLARALRFFQPDWALVAAALGLLLLSVTANLIKPWPLAVMVDSVLAARPLPAWLNVLLGGASQPLQIAALAGAVLLAHVGQGALWAGQNYLLIKAGLRGLARVRQALFHWLLRLSFRFHQAASQGDLIYRATWNTYSFQTLFHQGLFTFVTAALSLALMLGIMARLNLPLAGVALGTVPLVVVVMRYFGREMRARGVAAHAADGRVATLLQQGMEALPLTRACAREPAQEQRFGQQVLAAKTSRLLQHGWEILYLAFVALAFGLGTAGILWVGSLQVRAGRLTIGELLVFLAYLAQLHEPLNQLSHVGVTLSDATAGTQRVLEILDTPEDVRDKPGARPVVKAVSPALATTRTPQPLVIQGVLEFDGVTFGYESGRPVLQAVSFTLAAGESAALLGPSGAGKTTLLQLLPRFYDPLAGRVKLDGTDLCDLRLSELRRQIAFVMQEPILLPGTIAENIAFARPEASTEAIRAAALAAHADEFISRLPNGYETVVGEGAARLSAGEKQRLSLARAFLQDAPMLVLDEPTSSLDAQSEDLVLAGLAKLMRGRTTLWATHRPQALRLVERVLVLERGRLIEEGKPAQLAQRPGSYCLRLLQQAGREHSSYV